MICRPRAQPDADSLGRDFSGVPSQRNKALKPLMSRIPDWPALRFLQAYVFSGGFLEGSPAFRYCRNLARYEAMIQREMRNRTSAKYCAS